MFGNNKIKELQKELEVKNTFIQNSMNRIFGFSNTLTQTQNTETLIREGYQNNATIFSIIDLLVKSGSSVKPMVYKIKDPVAAKDYVSLTSGSTDKMEVKIATAHQRAFEPAFNNDLYRLLMNPNSMMGYAEFVQEFLGFKYLTGNGYIHTPRRKGTGKIFELRVWPSQITNIIVDKYDIKGYELGIDGGRIVADPKDMAHVKNFNPDWTTTTSHLYGQSPLKAAYKNLSVNNNSVETGKNILDQQGARGILFPKDGSTVFTEDQASALEAKYKEKHTLQGRFGKSGGVLIPSIEMGWINMGLPAGDLALLEQYNTSIKDLCGIYKVPSILLNDTAESKVESYREAKKYMYQQGVFPELVALRDELNRVLTPEYGKDLFIDFDFMSVPEIQEDMESIVKQLHLAWWLTPNEKRAVMKWARLEDKEMDNIFIPANMLNLNDGVTGSIEGGDS